MKTKHYILAILLCLTVFIAGFFLGKRRTEKPPGIVEETRETVVDTMSYNKPVPLSAATMGTQRYTFPVYRFIAGRIGKDSVCSDSVIHHYGSGAGGEPRCSGDSAIVDLPILQRHYADSTYEAWVSGPVDPRLDSVRVFARTTIVTHREWKSPKRWHLGVTAGVGYGTKGFQPYIGVGITYSIFSF